MKLSLKTLAAAVVMAAAASGASAAPIDNGAQGNGGLLFNIWDGASSYTLNLGYSIDSFETALADVGLFSKVYEADSTFLSYLSTANSSKLKFNVLATDTDGNRRVLETFTTATPTSKDTNGNFRTIAGGIQGSLTTGAGNVNSKLVDIVDDPMTPVNEAKIVNSAIFSSTEAGYFGKTALGATFNKLQSFDNTGTLTNDSYADGLNFMRVDALAGGLAKSVFTPYADNGVAVKVWLDSANALHIAAVPEPESYAMLLAGLGMLGFMARRRLNNRA